MAELFVNNFSTTLASSYTAGAGSISLTSATGLSGAPSTFTLGIWDNAATAGDAPKVLLRASNVSGTTVTVVAEGSDANADAGDIVALVESAKALANVGGLVPLKSLTASSSSSLDFTTRSDGSAIIQSDFTLYQIFIVNLVFSTAAILRMRMSTDGGSTWASGASDYRWVWGFAADSSDGKINDTADDAIDFRDTTSTLNANTGINGHLTLYDPGGAKLKTVVGEYNIPISDWAVFHGGGSYLSTTPVNAFQFSPSTGTFTSGTIIVYGVRLPA